MRLLRSAAVVGVLTLIAAYGPTFSASATHGGDTEVSNGSPDSPFSQNKQNEPAVAIDPANPNWVAAGSNDNIDMEACNAGDPTDCPFTPDIGGSGIYFSDDSGDTWVQPTYTGLTARFCLGDPDPTVTDDTCEPEVGPIGTLPNYYENDLVSDGDPALVFGPVPAADGSFAWENGSRLYYANLTSRLGGANPRETFKGAEAIYVSRTDDVPAAASGDNDAWMPPVRASKQSSATFADKEQIWVDQNSTSPFFGTAYICYASFTGNGAAPLVVSTSHDGGDTWETDKITPAHNVSPKQWGQTGCTIRTDSEGTAYVFWELQQSPFRFLPPQGRHFVARSFDGGETWTHGQLIEQITDPCFFVDPVIARCVEDGVAGARNDLAGAPSVDVAAGDPLTGAGATDVMVRAWADGRDGLDDEHVMVSWSSNGGVNWSDPVKVEEEVGFPDDRGYYAAPALSYNGQDLYVVYNAFTTPFRENTSDPRGMVGVVVHADMTAAGPVNWTVLNRGEEGDPRGSSQNNLQAGFLGDYVYADATNDYGVAVWNDVRDAADCPDMDAWRMALQTGDTSVPRPAVQEDCPPTFGN
ncbi:MAG TPA: sialidase family protein, partial [Actinomycetota bacterium]|nr:sialidase family protein [Actinomycetota bacterium]